MKLFLILHSFAEPKVDVFSSTKTIFGFQVQVEVFNLSLINTIHYDKLSSAQHRSADGTIKKVLLKEGRL